MVIEDFGSGKPYPLGANVDGEGVNFAIFSKHATRVDLCLFDEDGSERRVEMWARTDDVWHLHINNLKPGQLYGYRVDGPREPELGHWFNPSKLLIDPYAKEIVGKPDWSGPLWYYEQRDGQASKTVCLRDSADAMPKCRVVDISCYEGPIFRPEIPSADTVIYEMHARGMTMLHPDIEEEHRGRFLGLTAPAILSHLKSLGVTSVELLPIQAAMDEHHLAKLGLTNYWRYNTIGFFAAEPFYASGDGLAEIKAMVDCFHGAGIEVILDVVFNHTAEGDHNGPMLSFKGIDNKSYYHLWPEDHRYYDNHTGCGNALNLAEPRVLQMVLDCLRFWAGTMGVDGFRFDLATTLGRRGDGFDHQSHFFTSLRQDPVLGQIKLIAEPWDIGPGGYQLGGFPSPFIEWNDRFRDSARRFWRGDEAMLPELATRMLGSADVFAAGGRSPQASVNFLTAHDGFTLEDLVSFETKHNDANGEDNRDGHGANFSRNHGEEGPSSDPGIQSARLQQKMNLMATLLLSQGTPMLLAGDELGNSQDGNNNAYCQDNEIGWVRWPKRLDDDPFLDFVRWLIVFRRQNPILRQTSYRRDDDTAGEGEETATWLCPNGQPMTEDHWQVDWAKSVGLLLQGGVDRSRHAGQLAFVGDCLLIAFNASDDEQTYHAPVLQGIGCWVLQIDTTSLNGRPDRSRVVEAGQSFALPGRSLRVLSGSHVSGHLSAPYQSDQASLHQLARLQGIEPGYHDAFGVRHEVTDGCEKALLASMGIMVETDAEVHASLSETVINDCRRALRPVQVIRQGIALTIEINLQASATPRSVRWMIQTEAGEQHLGEVRLSEQMSGHDRPVDGTIFRTFLIETRLQLPIGYHRLSLEIGADDQVSSTIIVAPWRAFSSADLVAPRRHWGVLAPLYGLRSRRQTEIGDLVDLGMLAEILGKEGASFVGVNPLSALNPTFPHQASPYSPSSRLHRNELLIGLEASGGSPFTPVDRSSADLIDYTSLGHAKMEALRRHYRNATEGAGEETRLFEQYCARRGVALENFARFRVLFEHFHRQNPGHCWSWRRWPDAYQDQGSHEVQAFAAAHQECVAFYKYTQYLADRQLGEAQEKALAGGMPIGLYLDLAVGVDPHGADCWADPACFASGANLGAPPDAFNQNGQNWALAPFVPSRLQDRAYQPFIDLVRASMRHAGALRIDHIIGLMQSFWIPDDADLGGAYVRYPIDDLLGIVALESHRHHCLVIGEDLGNLPEGLRERLESHHISSSRVMYFERDHKQGFCQSQAYPSQALTTVGTHDLPTLAGFWRGRDIDVRASLGIDTDYQSAARKHDREADRQALLGRLEAEGLMPEGIDIQDPPAEVTPCLLAAVYAYLGKSPSALVAVQLEDLLGLVEQANLPGTVDEHPNWRRRMPHDIEELPDLPIARAIFDIMSALRPSPSRQV